MKNKSETQTAQVEVLEELTEDEERERHRLEIKVDRALSESWSALKQLRDRRLYRSTHSTFEEYAKDRFGYNRAHAYEPIPLTLETRYRTWQGGGKHQNIPSDVPIEQRAVDTCVETKRKSALAGSVVQFP